MSDFPRRPVRARPGVWVSCCVIPGTCPRRYRLHPRSSSHTLSWSKDGKLWESLPSGLFMTLKQPA